MLFYIKEFSAEKTSNGISPTLAYIFLAASIILIGLGISIIFIYKNIKEKKSFEKKQGFKIEKGRWEIMSFWSNYAFVFTYIACFVAALIFFSLALAGLIT